MKEAENLNFVGPADLEVTEDGLRLQSISPGSLYFVLERRIDTKTNVSTFFCSPNQNLTSFQGSVYDGLHVTAHGRECT